MQSDASSPATPAPAAAVIRRLPTHGRLPVPPPMFSDLRYALRSLGKSPGFSAIVIITLALGIGACTAIFSVVHQALLRSPAHVDLDRVVVIEETRPPDGAESRVSVANFLDWKQKAQSIETIVASTGGRTTLTGEGEPLPLTRESATEEHFVLFRRSMALGRWFSPGEFEPGRDKVVVLSHETWRRIFGGAPEVLGRRIELDGQLREVIGVEPPAPGRRMAPAFSLPLVFTDKERADRAARTLAGVVAHLKPGVTLADAQAEMDVIAAQLAIQYPDTNHGWGVKLTVLRDLAEQGLRTPLWTMLGAVTCVLLIACANIANLLLVRATGRQREISIRAALGAGRARLTRQLFAESLTLAIFGGGAGVLLAQWGLSAFGALAPSELVRRFTLELNVPMLVFALGLGGVTGLIFGLAPAWLASHVDLTSAMKQGTRGSSGGGSSGRIRRTMVVLQVACALVLLSGAGLFLRSFLQLSRVDPGFVAERAIGMSLFALSPQRYRTNEQRAAFVDDVLTRLRSLPGVQAAGATLQLPINASRPSKFGFELEGSAPSSRASWPAAAYYTASPGYFRAAGFRLSRGRDFSSTDTAEAPRVVIINETLARQYFGEENPVGRRLRLAMDHDDWREIVGVASDIKQDGLRNESICQVYEPIAQGQYVGTSFVVRHTGDPAALMPLLKQQVYAVDKKQPVTLVAPLADQVEANTAVDRFIAMLVTVFSLIGLLIAAIGIYGVMAHHVSRRTMEIGIRMALGASNLQVLRQVIGQGMRIVGAGLALGLVATLGLTQLIRAVLYGTSPRDPVTLLVVVLVFLAIALLACWLPARRATRVDPLVALRAE